MASEGLDNLYRTIGHSEPLTQTQFIFWTTISNGCPHTNPCWGYRRKVNKRSFLTGKWLMVIGWIGLDFDRRKYPNKLCLMRAGIPQQYLFA
jgi:hypothetical protein